MIHDKNVVIAKISMQLSKLWHINLIPRMPSLGWRQSPEVEGWPYKKKP